jgi:hypothetical protein
MTIGRIYSASSRRSMRPSWVAAMSSFTSTRASRSAGGHAPFHLFQALAHAPRPREDARGFNDQREN